MGCGASKGTEAAAPTEPSKTPGSGTEFTPDSKPGPAGQPCQTDDATRAKETQEAAKRVDDIVKVEADEFEDDTVVKLDKPDPPLQAAPVSVLPPPPATPPVAAQRASHQGDNSAGGFGAGRSQGPDPAAEELSYFPEQVSLNVGAGARAARPGGGSGSGSGGGGTSAASGLFSQPPPAADPAGVTTLQRFTTPDRPSQPAPSQPAPSGPAPSGPALQPVPSNRQRQLAPLPSQRSQPQSPPQSQAQPLSESGPGGSGRQGPPADDIWSSLQSQYRIREQVSAAPGSADLGSSGGRSGTGSRGTGEPGGPKEVLVLGDDDDFDGGARSTMNTTMNRTARGAAALTVPPPRPGAQPKRGGWGNGQMAQAGELMLGEDDWLEKDKPPGLSSLGMQLPPPPGAAQPQSHQAVVSYSSGKARADTEFDERRPPVALKGPKGKARESAPVMCEDIDDVDTLLEDELQKQGLSDRNLASKLAAYEAQFKDDD